MLPTNKPGSLCFNVSHAQKLEHQIKLLMLHPFDLSNATYMEKTSHKDAVNKVN